MRSISISVLVAFLILCGPFSVPTAAQGAAPKPGPEQQRLGDWVGQWSCDASDESTFTMNCDWFSGGFFLVCSSTATSASGETTENVFIQGYDHTKRAYTWYRYWSNGFSDKAQGWVRDNTWTWLMEDAQTDEGAQVRWQVAAELSPDVFTYKWEQSVEGQPWKAGQSGKCSKAK